MKKSSRKLQTTLVADKEYYVDIQRNCLVDINNERKKISFDRMEYTGNGYVIKRDTLPNSISWPESFDHVVIPQKVELDPEGMSLKYNLAVDQLAGKSDFEVIVDQKKYHERFIQSRLPEIDIAGDLFTIDLFDDELRLVDEPSKIIDLDIWFNDRHEFYYNIETKQAVLIEPTIDEYPKNVVFVELPLPDKLDPVAMARMGGVNVKSYLLSHPFEKELKAKVVPLQKTEVAAIVKGNKALLNGSKEEILLKRNREGKDKGKGKHV